MVVDDLDRPRLQQRRIRDTVQHDADALRIERIQTSDANVLLAIDAQHHMLVTRADVLQR